MNLTFSIIWWVLIHHDIRRPCDGVWCGDDMPCQWGLMSWTEVFEAWEPPRLRSETLPRDLWKFGRTEMKHHPFWKDDMFQLESLSLWKKLFFVWSIMSKWTSAWVLAFLAFLAFFFFHGVQQVSKGVSSKERFQVGRFMSTTCTSMISYTLGRYHHTPTSLIPHVFFVFGWKSPVVRYFPRKHLQALRIEGGWSFKSSGKLGWSQPGVVVI